MSDHAIAGIRPRNQLVFLLLSLVSCASSVALTINFCWHLRSDASFFAGVMAVSIGFAWECAKYAFAPLGLRFLRAQSPALILGGLVLMAVTLMLVCGSVVASLGYLLQSDAASQRRTMEQSRAYRDSQQQLAALDAEISLLHRSAKADVSRHYRLRAMETLTRADTLRERRDGVTRALQRIESPTLADGSFFGQLASIFETRPTSKAQAVRLIAYLVVSLMLEIISICAVTLWAFCTGSTAIGGSSAFPQVFGQGLSGFHQRTDFGATGSSSQAVPAMPKRWKPFAHNRSPHEEGRADTGTTQGMDTRYSAVRDLIVSGQIKPTIRAVRYALHISQEPARRFLAQLCGEGILTALGNNRYHVAC